MNPQTDIALLRSQLADARKQLEVNSATIAKLAKDKRELQHAFSCFKNEALGAINRLLHADNLIAENVGMKSDQAMHRIAALDFAQSFLDRNFGTYETLTQAEISSHA